MKLWHVWVVAVILALIAMLIDSDTSDRAFERRSQGRIDRSVFGDGR